MEHPLHDTEAEYAAVIAKCRATFVNKMLDYSSSWRIMRPTSITDQIFIKAKRIRTLETTHQAMVEEGIAGEFAAIVNYGLMALAQLNLPDTVTADLDQSEATGVYDTAAQATMQLMLAKNHDYGEAWRDMRVTSFTDMILTKVQRIKQIEDNNGVTKVSEGVEGNYMDIVNYAVFALIQMGWANEVEE